MRVLTVGTFDFVHAGHFKLFERCSKFGFLTVAVNTDEFIHEYKGEKPIFSFLERLSLVEKCPFVDRVIPNWSNETLKPLLEAEQPNILAIGSDWAKKDYYTQIGVNQQWLDDNNIELIYLPYTTEISSSTIKERCQSRLRS